MVEKNGLEVERSSFPSGSDIVFLFDPKRYTKHCRILIPHSQKGKVMDFLLLSTCRFL